MTRVAPLLALLFVALSPACREEPVASPSLPRAAAPTGPSGLRVASRFPGMAPVDAGPPAPPPPPAPLGPGDLVATLDTSLGTIQLRLFEDRAPKTVANFVGLAEGSRPWKDPRTGQDVKRPFYDGTAFSRVAPGLVVQAGDLRGDGTGDPGYAIPDEFHPQLRHNRPGVLTMANRGKNTGGSQFMITLRPLPLLDDRNAVFGEVVTGMEVVEAISRVAAAKHRPQREVLIRRVEIKKLASVAARSPG